MASYLRVLGPSAALLALLPGLGHAGGFSASRFGGELGTPTADQPTAIYFNPAALAIGRGTRIFIEGLFAWRTASYDRPVAAIDNPLREGDQAAGTPPDGVAANTGEATLANLIASPFAGVASDLGVDNLGVGLALYVPFGGQSAWDKVDTLAGDPRYPGAIDGPQRWSTIEGVLRALYVTAAGSYYLPGPRLALGASVSLVRQEINTVRARTAIGSDDLVAGATLLEGRSTIDVKGSTVAAGLGVLWQPVDDLWLGASYQSQPGFGVTSQSGDLTNKFGSDPVAVTQIEVEQALPDVTRLGASYRVSPVVEARLSLDFQRWSVFDQQCLVDATLDETNCALEPDGSQSADAVGVVVSIPRHWKNSYGVRGGASYWLAPALELQGGLSFDTSAVPARYIDPSLVDMNKVIVHAGVRYAVLDGDLLLTAGLNNVFYFSRQIEPRSRAADGSSDGFQPPSRVPDFAGTYKLNVLYGSMAAEYQF